jgi:hypothetical protein
VGECLVGLGDDMDVAKAYDLGLDGLSQGSIVDQHGAIILVERDHDVQARQGALVGLVDGRGFSWGRWIRKDVTIESSLAEFQPNIIELCANHARQSAEALVHHGVNSVDHSVLKRIEAALHATFVVLELQHSDIVHSIGA